MSSHSTPSPLSRCPGLAGLRRFAHEEDGAAYTLSVVMVIPVYALLMCAIVEMTMLMTAKLGTVYSAYAAARTASVWSSATTWEKAEEKAKKAAIKTMVPFASGTQPLLNSAAPEALPDAIFYTAAYTVYSNRAAPIQYIMTKYGYAVRHTKIEIEGPPKKWDADIRVQVTYDFPFNVPGIGQIFGKLGPDGRRYYRMTSEVILPNEGPQNDRNTIGIGYGKLE